MPRLIVINRGSSAVKRVSPPLICKRASLRTHPTTVISRKDDCSPKPKKISALNCDDAFTPCPAQVNKPGPRP